MKLRLSLKQIWTSLIFIAVFVPVIAVMAWYGQELYRERIDTILLLERQANESLRNQIESELKRFNTLLENKSDPLALLIDENIQSSSLKDINSLLINIVEREPAIREVMIMSEQAKVIAAIDPKLNLTGKKIASAEELQMVAIDWGFDQIHDLPEVVIPFLNRRYIGSPKQHDDFIAFSIAMPIGFPANAALIAIIDVDMLWPEKTEKHGISTEKSRDYILDRRGSLISKVKGSNYNPGDILTHFEITRASLINDTWSSNVSYIGITGQSVFGTLTYVPSLNWTLISEVIVSEVTQPIWQDLRKIMLFTLVGVCLFMWIIWILVNKTLRSIDKTCEVIDYVAKGDYQHVLALNGIRELDAMTVGVNNMALARQSAENALRVRERNQTIILNSIAEGVITIDQLGKIETFNKTAESIFGYSFDEVDGKNISSLMPEPYSKEHDKYINSYLTTGKARVIGLGREVLGLRKNKEIFPMRLSVVELPQENADIRRFIGSCQDLTQLKHNEEQLRRSQKMDALGKLTGGVAHDFNNMLGVIMGFAELLKEKLAGQSKLEDYADQIYVAGERGAKLTQKLLSFSRQKASDNVNVNINAVLTEQQHMLEKVLTARINLTLDLEENLWTVKLDQSDLEDAILNLCINAMHAMDEGGKLSIHTKNEKLNEMEARILNVSAGEYVLLSIIDTGIGMDYETKEKIFEPFFSTKGENGTGLGLSQVYGFLQRSQGAIKIYSEPGKGSQFLFYFPKSLDYVVEAQESFEKVSKNLKGSETLLVVDDEQALLQIAQDILSNKGYHVLTAKDGNEALAVLGREPVDLLISDVIMPSMDGYQLATEVMKRYPNIKIQMVSGFTDDRHHALTHDSLHQNILQKPYRANELLERVRHLLKSSPDKENITNHTILVMDDEEPLRELYKIHLSKLGFTVILASGGDEVIRLFQQANNSENHINAVILDLSIPGSIGGKEVADKIRAVDSQAKIIVSSGDSESPEMQAYEKFGFQGALSKDFDRKEIKQVLDEVLEA